MAMLKDNTAFTRVFYNPVAFESIKQLVVACALPCCMREGYNHQV